MKTLFKISAVLFLINLWNLSMSFTFLIYKSFGLFEIVGTFVQDLFAWSALLIIPLCCILIGLLSYPHKSIKLWKWNLR